LTREKVNQISLLEPLPYEAPEEVPAEEIEVVDEDDISGNKITNAPKSSSDNNSDDDNQAEENGQGKLF